jgi:hypothetical protein
MRPWHRLSTAPQQLRKEAQRMRPWHSLSTASAAVEEKEAS